MKEMAFLNVIESNGNVPWVQKNLLFFSRTITCSQTLLWQNWIANNIHGSAILGTRMLPLYLNMQNICRQEAFVRINLRLHAYMLHWVYGTILWHYTQEEVLNPDRMVITFFIRNWETRICNKILTFSKSFSKSVVSVNL